MRAHGAVGRAVFALATVCGLTETALTQTTDPAPAYDVTARRVGRIQPGTVIDKEAPKGWSHLIAKARSRVGTGDVDQMTEQTKDLASFLFSAILANVEPDEANGQKRYRLSGLAVGIGTPIRGKDVIISTETQRRLGANLGFLHRLGLERAQKRLDQVVIVARSNTLILFDSPMRVVRGGRHRPGVNRHALLVDPPTGRLTPLTWFILQDDAGGYHAEAEQFEVVAPNKVGEVTLHIDAREFRLGLITEEAIAVDKLPQGEKQIAIPEGLKGIVHRARLTEAMAGQLETTLRQLVLAPAR